MLNLCFFQHDIVIGGLLKYNRRRFLSSRILVFYIRAISKKLRLKNFLVFYFNKLLLISNLNFLNN